VALVFSSVSQVLAGGTSDNFRVICGELLQSRLGFGLRKLR
jgi:hypothetical protein